jgi:hypothetical protein
VDELLIALRAAADRYAQLDAQYVNSAERSPQLSTERQRARIELTRLQKRYRARQIAQQAASALRTKPVCDNHRVTERNVRER